jgi:LAS superfamily LD-carboxypeptidase LdcB
MSYRHRHIAALCALALSFVGAKEASANNAQIAQKHIQAAGLLDAKSCIKFADREALDAHKKRWHSALSALQKESPAYVRGWIVGAEPPPKAVIAESRRQLDCMLARMVDDSANPASPLILNHLSQENAPTKAQMKPLAEHYRKNSTARDQLMRRVISSHYRDAASQSAIWHRKYNFYGRSFNMISKEAGKRCGLSDGQTWKPTVDAHRRCWLKTLSTQEREREILNASSAPGISRHHWGTEFDIFSLNPVQFHKGAPLYDEYVWMREHAAGSGFFKPFDGHETLGEHTYIEERWHWSYYPIAQALMEIMLEHPEQVTLALNSQWDTFEKRWAGKGEVIPYFGYIRKHWRDYVFNIAPLRALRSSPTSRIQDAG